MPPESIRSHSFYQKPFLVSWRDCFFALLLSSFLARNPVFSTWSFVESKCWECWSAWTKLSKENYNNEPLVNCGWYLCYSWTHLEALGKQTALATICESCKNIATGCLTQQQLLGDSLSSFPGPFHTGSVILTQKLYHTISVCPRVANFLTGSWSFKSNMFGRCQKVQ